MEILFLNSWNFRTTSSIHRSNVKQHQQQEMLHAREFSRDTYIGVVVAVDVVIFNTALLLQT